MKSNQSGNLLVINIDKLRDILGVSLYETDIKLPKGVDPSEVINKLVRDITDDFDSHVLSLEEITNSYKLLSSLINTKVCDNLLGRPNLANDRFLMNAVISGVNNTIEEFCNETLKKFVTQDEWADVASRINEKNKPFTNHPWSQVKGFNQNTGTFNGFGVPPVAKFRTQGHAPGGDYDGNVGYPPNTSRFGTPHGIPNPYEKARGFKHGMYSTDEFGVPNDGSQFGFPTQQPPELINSIRITQLVEIVRGLEHNSNDLGVMVGRIAEKLDNIQSQPTSAEKPLEKMNLEHFTNRLDGFEMYLNDLGKAVHKLNKEMEILSDRLPKQESSDVVVTGFKEGGSHGLPEVNKEIKQPVVSTEASKETNQPDVKRNFSLKQLPGTAAEEGKGADGSVDNWATIESVRPDAEAYYNK